MTDADAVVEFGKWAKFLKTEVENSVSLRFMTELASMRSIQHKPVKSSVLSSVQTSPSKAQVELEAKEEKTNLWRSLYFSGVSILSEGRS